MFLTCSGQQPLLCPEVIRQQPALLLSDVKNGAVKATSSHQRGASVPQAAQSCPGEGPDSAQQTNHGL